MPLVPDIGWVRLLRGSRADAIYHSGIGELQTLANRSSLSRNVVGDVILSSTAADGIQVHSWVGSLLRWTFHKRETDTGHKAKPTHYHARVARRDFLFYALGALALGSLGPHGLGTLNKNRTEQST